MVSTRGINKSFAIPERNITGRKTITVVNVETNIGDATSRAASSVAFILLTPCVFIKE